MPSTLVIQSQRMPLPAAWMARCLRSVKGWAGRFGSSYRFHGDELFDYLPDALRAKTASQPVVASDLARLLVLRRALEEGYESVVWCDADFLIFAPERFALPACSYALGREVWIQDGGARQPVARVKVHNAFLLFRQGNPFLEFYIHAAERLIRSHRGRMAPQLIGPKLLAAIHNIVQCPVAERAGMLSPLVARDLLRGEGPCLRLFRDRSLEAPAGVNLCGSLVGTDLSHLEVARVVELLLSKQRC